MKNLSQSTINEQLLAPGATVAATVTSSAKIMDDIQPVVKIIVNVGAVAAADADNLFTFTITESDDDSTYTALPSQFYTASAWDRLINATAEANAAYSFGFKTNKKYFKVVATETGTASAIFAITAVTYAPKTQA